MQHDIDKSKRTHKYNLNPAPSRRAGLKMHDLKFLHIIRSKGWRRGKQTASPKEQFHEFSYLFFQGL